jgi:hypothetical protein
MTGAAQPAQPSRAGSTEPSLCGSLAATKRATSGDSESMSQARDRIRIQEPTLLIRIPRLYRPGMSPDELYEATRGHWRLGTRRNGAELAMAVADGIVREVYVIRGWYQAGAIFPAAPVHGQAPIDRWEFVGNLAPERLRSKYVGQSVKGYFAPGNQSPVAYLNC